MNRRYLNQTAYRILTVLGSLIKGPKSVTELNTMFQTDPLIEKTVSQDTMCLYINTLKQLGCIIKRPSASNGFAYQLLYHPFAYKLKKEDIATLKKAWENIVPDLSHWDVCHLGTLLTTVFQNAANQNSDALRKEFMADLRIMDLDSLEKRISTLENHCERKDVLRIQYESPTNKSRILDFLPTGLFQLGGLIYLQGQSAERNNTSMLRLDRIQSVTILENPDLQKKLLGKKQVRQEYVMRIRNDANNHLEQFGEEPDEHWIDWESPEHVIVKCRTNNPFLLKQKLLASPDDVQILYPAEFKSEMEQTLQQMQELYKR